MRSRSRFRPGLTAVGSLVALIAGIVLRSHYEPLTAICQSGIGALGQAVDTQAQTSCSLDSGLSDAGLFLIVVGALILAGAVMSLLYAGQRRQRGDGWQPLDPPK